MVLPLSSLPRVGSGGTQNMHNGRTPALLSDRRTVVERAASRGEGEKEGREGRREKGVKEISSLYSAQSAHIIVLSEVKQT